MPKSLTILNGPNLNLLGQREPEIYGRTTLSDIQRNCESLAREHGAEIAFLQSNAEHQLIDWIHQARGTASGIIINPGAFSHTSIAILDALNAFEGPVLEVHITNIHKRESFRHHSYVSARADGVIAGFGIQGYAIAVRHMLSFVLAS
jgi:3-dehydroquinate dehydratase II